jgi:hypothetical protein
MAFEGVHHLEYFFFDNGENHYWKKVDGECVICSEAEFPLLAPCMFQNWWASLQSIIEVFDSKTTGENAFPCHVLVATKWSWTSRCLIYWWLSVLLFLFTILHRTLLSKHATDFCGITVIMMLQFLPHTAVGCEDFRWIAGFRLCTHVRPSASHPYNVIVLELL